MAEYIDRQAVLDAIPQTNEDKTVSLFGVVADFIVLVSEIPAADVEPVVHGHWIKRRYGLRKIYYHCSHCHFGLSKIGDDHYCPYCGAKMDEEANNGR